MIRLRLRSLAGATALAFGSIAIAQAATVDEQGAVALKKTLVGPLDQSSPFAQSLTVKPDGNRYEILFDIETLLEKYKVKDLVVKGLEPFSTFVTPHDDGLWSLEANQRLDVNGSFKSGPQTTDFQYKIGSSVFNGLLDPKLRYLRSGDWTINDLQLKTDTDKNALSVGLAGMTYKLATTDATTAGRQNIATTGTISNFVETISAKDQLDVGIQAGKMDFQADIKGVDIAAIGDLVIALLDDAKNPDALEKQVKAKLPTLFPLLTSLTEDIRLSDVAVSVGGSPMGSAAGFGYRIFVDGPSNATRIGFGTTLDRVAVNDAVVPAVYQDFLPEHFDSEISLTNLDFSSFWQQVSARDFKAKTEEAKDDLDLLFPNNRFTFEFPKIVAVSKAYDFEMSGVVTGRFDNANPPKDMEIRTTLLARDLDKTIAAVQAITKADPNAANVSMGMMMAKGFAKTDADGRSRWDVVVAPDGSVDINGQQIKGPDAPKSKLQP